MRVYISALMGVNGQTLLAGLIDAFKMPIPETKELLESIGNEIYPTTVSFSKYTDGLRMDIMYEKGNGVSYSQFKDAIEKSCGKLGLTIGKEFAIKVFDELSDSISKFHNIPKENLVFNDLGNPDTLISIVGSAYIYEKAKLSDADVFCSELYVGNGQTHFDGKFYYVPTPIVKDFISGLKWKFDKNGEMIDPLGACLLKNLAKRQEDNSYINGRVGIGYGTKEFEGVAGRTRVVIG